MSIFDSLRRRYSGPDLLAALQSLDWPISTFPVAGREIVVTPETASRFWGHVAVDDPDDEGSCWSWTRSLRAGGYGNFRASETSVKANRLAYELAYGDLVPELQVMHKCGVRKCCRPDHLTLGTNKDNSADRAYVHPGVSKWRGVTVYKNPRLHNPWRATVRERVDGKTRTLHSSYHPTEIAAAYAANRFRLEHFGSLSGERDRASFHEIITADGYATEDDVALLAALDYFEDAQDRS